MSKESLEKVYLVAKIAATVAFAVAVFQYSSYQYSGTGTSYEVMEWEENGTLARIDLETGETKILMGNRLEDTEWVKLGGPEDE